MLNRLWNLKAYVHRIRLARVVESRSHCGSFGFHAEFGTLSYSILSTTSHLFLLLVKRKHINQNRDIIKTNALGQLRMRELESRIHALESEKADQALEMNQLVTKVRRLEHAHASVRQGWEIMTRGMRSLDSFQDASQLGFQESRTDYTSSPLHGLGLGMESQSQPQQHLLINPLHQKSNRIHLDRSTLPAGVVRSIARAPGAHIIDVMEGEEDEDEIDEEEEEGGEEDHHRDWNRSQMEREEETVRIFESEEVAEEEEEEDQEEASEITPRLESQSKFHSEWQSTNPLQTNSNLLSTNGLPLSASHSSESLLELAAAIASTGSSGLTSNSSQTVVGLWQPTPFDAEGAPSPLSSPPLAFDEEAFVNKSWGIYVSDPTGLARIQQEGSSTSTLNASSQAPPKTNKARRSSRRHSGLLSAPDTPQVGFEETRSNLSRASSLNSLTDFESLPTDSPFDSELDEGEKLDSSPEKQVRNEMTPSSDGSEYIPSEKENVKKEKEKEKGKRKTLAKKSSLGKLEGTVAEGEFQKSLKRCMLSLRATDV